MIDKMRERMMRFWLPGLAAAGLAVGCGQPAATDPATPVVPVAAVIRTNLSKQVPIPGEFRPYTEVELHAKVSGYLAKMNVDFGDRVQSNQLLAVIEVPELQDQLNNALADEQRAEADYTNAHLAYTRLVAVNRQHPNLVAQQDIDAATAKDLAGKAAIAAAKAEAGRYETLVSYTQITAPFKGVITHRYLDPGALVEAGTASGGAGPLLRLSDNYHLRLDFPVSVEYIKDVKIGDAVQVRVDSLNGRVITGKIARASDRANFDTRTMMTELEVDNPDLKLVPGMYASVFFEAERRTNVLAIPIQAVPPGQTSSVLVVNTQNEIEERPVTLGLETPFHYEVVTGLKEGDKVVIGNRSALRPGEKVEPKAWQAEAMEN
jgi:RND family efflux transporter MFP subunit